MPRYSKLKASQMLEHNASSKRNKVILTYCQALSSVVISPGYWVLGQGRIALYKLSDTLKVKLLWVSDHMHI